MSLVSTLGEHSSDKSYWGSRCILGLWKQVKQKLDKTWQNQDHRHAIWLLSCTIPIRGRLQAGSLSRHLDNGKSLLLFNVGVPFSWIMHTQWRRSWCGSIFLGYLSSFITIASCGGLAQHYRQC